MTGWVPARLGVDEGGAMSAFAASGLSPGFGLTLALTRRARDLSWCLAGPAMARLEIAGCEGEQDRE
jgi:hypothetical protein